MTSAFVFVLVDLSVLVFSFRRNQLTEKNSIEWAYKTIWFGRYATQYKFHPEFLEDENSKIQLNPEISN